MRDRRTAARGRVNWPVSLETFEGRVIQGEVVDASTAGLRVQAHEPVPAGTAVTATVVLPRGADRLEVVARVVRAIDGELALDFVGLPRTEARRVGSLMTGWEPRRRAPRAPARLPIEVLRTRGRLDGAHLVDLSAFGARVIADQALRPGERVRVRLGKLDGDGDLDVGAIVWDVAPSGAVLLFVNLREAEFRRLQGYLAELLRRAP